MKISAKAKDNRLTVKVKTSSEETINAKELDRFARVFLRCYLKPQMVKPNLVEYTGPAGISLQDRLKKPVTKRDFLFILEYIVVAVQKLHSNGFPIYNLQMDMQNIFINETTKELQFLYIPATGVTSRSNILALFQAVISAAKPALEPDTGYVSRFYYFFSSLRPFNIDRIEDFIQKEDRSVVNTVKKYNAGQSGFMTSDHQHYYEYMDRTAAVEMPVVPQPSNDATALLPEEDATGLLPDEEGTGLMPNEEATGLLEEPSLPVEPSLPEDDDDGSGETMLLVDLQPAPAPVVYPRLERVQTNETITVNKPVFRVGKERSYVDYFVNNNNAVSRSHADIISRADGYYVVDLNSKNGTYINNQKIDVQMETPIQDGDTLRLANEEFVFRVSEEPKPASNLCPRCRAELTPGAKFCIYCGNKLQ